MPSPTTNFLIFDGQEFVTYASSIDPPISDVSAIRRPLTQSRQRNVERYIELTPTDVVFHLDGLPLTTTPLAAGDAITDSHAVTYSVLFVERQVLDNTVVVVCRPPT